ncbi:hypothetical protein AB1Y20_020911 [Prymnesium parvum]|uniref:glutathione synthase n=1 Tax=Prymnesium parvum TaxID=97485 RepID=A0AB34JI61_PRYPA
MPPSEETPAASGTAHVTPTPPSSSPPSSSPSSSSAAAPRLNPEAPQLSPEASEPRLRAAEPPPPAERAPEPPEASRYSSLQQWVDEVAVSAGARPALLSTARSLSYAELRACASFLASRLALLGARADAIVAVYCPRGVEMILAVLGVLYASAAYLPLDPKLSDAELRGLARLSRPVAAATTRVFRPALLRVFGDTLPHESVPLPAECPPPSAPPRGAREHGAYALFTSGSTGKAKCVVQTHGAVLHLFAADRALYGYSSRDLCLLVNPLHFDISVSDIFNALTTGGQLLLPSDDELTEARVGAWLREGCFSVSSMTPSAFRRLLLPALLHSPPPPRLRLLAFSGEPLDADELHPLLRRCAGLALVNKYGLTEVQDVTHLRYAADAPTPRGCVGWPLRGCRVYVIDAADGAVRLVPQGHVGEIAVGGPQVARGYLPPPDAGAPPKFVADTLCGEGRLFRTGDAGRWAEDGSLVCLGRLSDQLRVDGELVDLHAAEAALRNAGVVHDVTLVPCALRREREKRLVAFFIPLGAAAAAAEEPRPEAAAEVVEGEAAAAGEASLRAQAEAALLRSARPAAYVAVRAFPLTSSGKVSRSALQQLLPHEAQEAAGGATAAHALDLALRKEVGCLTAAASDRRAAAKALAALRVEMLPSLKAMDAAKALALFRERASALHLHAAPAPSIAAAPSPSPAPSASTAPSTSAAASKSPAPSTAAAPSPSPAPSASAAPSTSAAASASAAASKSPTPSTSAAASKSPFPSPPSPTPAPPPSAAPPGSPPRRPPPPRAPLSPLATGGGEAEMAEMAEMAEAVEVALQGNLKGSLCRELVTYASLNGVVQQELTARRPTHVPLALLPSRFPRAAFELATRVVCPALLSLYEAAARDHAFLRAAIDGAASDEEARGAEPRLRRMGALLRESHAPLSLGVVRTDFMLDAAGELKQVETNTISAAFSHAAPRVQRAHARLAARAGLAGEVPLMRSDEGVVRALAAARRRGGGGGVLFVVLAEEHLLCENLIEQALEEECGAVTHTLTMEGCAQRLQLGGAAQGEAPPLLLDGQLISVVYFRGGITAQCFGSNARWQARRLIERSSAVKCPSAGWWVAGTKAVQAALAADGAIERLCPQLDAPTAAALRAALTRMRPVGDAAAEAEARAAPHKFILKKEPLGVWVDGEMIAKLDELRGRGARDYFLMDKLLPRAVEGVAFVREGTIVATGRGLQEFGLYGVCLGDGESHEASCVGYLMRTKPEGEADGGVCKGVAVLDSLLLDDEAAPPAVG